MSASIEKTEAHALHLLKGRTQANEVEQKLFSTLRTVASPVTDWLMRQDDIKASTSQEASISDNYTVSTPVGAHARRSIHSSVRGVASATSALGGAVLGFLGGGTLASLVWVSWEIKEFGLHIAVVENAAIAVFWIGGILGAIAGGITSGLRSSAN
jgi:hypothetical protein